MKTNLKSAHEKCRREGIYRSTGCTYVAYRRIGVGETFPVRCETCQQPIRWVLKFGAGGREQVAN
jgi:hypothetical protein